MGALGTVHANVRWRDDTGWEFKCGYCAEWWPLTGEFWWKRSMSRCRACWLEYQKGYQNERYANDPVFRAGKRDAAKLSAWKDRQLNPDTMKARKRAYYLANREPILRKARARYWRNREDEKAA